RARVSQSDRTHTEFIKRTQQIQIMAKWLDALHCDEEAYLVRIERALNFFGRSTNDAVLRLLRLSIKPRDLIGGNLQSAVRQVAVLDVKRRPDNFDPTRFELRQKLRSENIRLRALLVEIHRQIEMHVDHATGVQPLHASFDPFVLCHYGVGGGAAI